ncbi:glycosyltransferase [Mesorhizobium sp. CU2]|uniref:glycosyltransferase n=1 Tax=unclassified Mesorhizobium TaxID=325217 RepID=UPI001126E2D4|nr:MULTISPECIES: glycosyltransferase [unclassified Mesorhizobium]TPN89781.1 glycosyltransferase [Mesorhizobium sp. CU3]TPO17972.1 glycosyltransferase [Mesorhizobium sp. CU2]
MAADISVVIPAKNAAATIEAALGSLVPDKALILEILVIDDGSDDRTAAVATSCAQRHGLPVDVLSVRLGSAGAARNAGIAQAKGAFIFFLDADDAVMPGSLSLLHAALTGRAGAGIATGASIRRTEGRPDKLKTPHGYGPDKRRNASRYLRNELWPIAMGSALVAKWATADVRFPEAIGLDEDTCYWTALLARADVVAIDAPVLLYNHDEERMTRRFVAAPRETFVAVAKELGRLTAAGVDRDALQWRKAWVAQRIARQLIKHRMFKDAAGMMRAVLAHRELGRGWKALQYRGRILLGRLSRNQVKAPGRKRRTLIVSFDPAFPAVSGADLRTFGNASAAATFGPVRLASIRAAEDIAPPSGIRTVSLTDQADTKSHSVGWRRINGENRIPRVALTRLKRLAREFRPDTIVVESIWLFKLLRPLRRLTEQLILDMHNIESSVAEQGPAGPGQLVPSDIRKLEQRAATIVDRIWVCSHLDRERLAAFVGRPMPIDVVPNGIPRAASMAAELPAAPATANGFPTIIYVGHLGYGPNVEAAEKLANVILPRIRRALPSAKLQLAGRSPSPRSRALATLHGIELIDSPEDIGPLLSAAHLTIVPLAMGGGTRIKILEAMAWGVPVVATPLAVEGLDLANGEDVLLSSSDEGLADLAVELCSNPARMARLRAGAHQTAWSRFGPQATREAVSRGLDNTGQ